MVHLRTGWTYYPPTISSSSAHWQHDAIGSRIKVGIIGDLQPGLNSFFCRTPISTGEPVAEVTSTPVFRVQVVVFRLLETFNSLAIDGEVCTVTPLTQHILTCTDAHSLSAHHT